MATQITENSLDNSASQIVEDSLDVVNSSLEGKKLTISYGVNHAIRNSKQVKF